MPASFRPWSSAHRHDPVERVPGLVGRCVQLPAELADVRDPRRTARRATDLDVANRAEGKRVAGEILSGDRAHDVPALRPHDPEHRPLCGDVDHDRVRIGVDVALEPGEIAPRHPGAAHHQEFVLGEPRHRELRLDAAALVQPVGVHEPAGLDVDIVAADALQRPTGVAALDDVLGKARLVEQGDALARRAMLGRRVLEPVLAMEAVLVARLDALRGEPVRPLPARRLAETGAALGEPLVHRRVPHVARGGELAVGVVAVVEQSERLRHPFLDVGLRALEGEHPAEIIGGEVERRVALVHPLRAGPADPARGDDADGVQSARDVEISDLRRFAHVELVVVGEALGAAEEAPPPDLLEHGHALHGVGEDRHELLFHVAGELVEAEVVRDRVEPDGPRVRLERPDQQAACVLPVVGALVLVAQHRQVARQVGELLGVGVVVLAGVQRDRHPGEPAEVARPQPCRAHHELAGDVARLRLHSRPPDRSRCECR